MRRIGGSLIVVATLLAVPGTVRAACKAPPGMACIDGRTNPDALPEYVVWGSAFDTLALVKPPLKLPPADAALLKTALEHHVTRSTRCEEHTAAHAQTLRKNGVDEARVGTAMKDATLKCRGVMLDARDDLLARLSDEGRTALVTWVLNERASVTLTYPKDDAEFFLRSR